MTGCIWAIPTAYEYVTVGTMVNERRGVIALTYGVPTSLPTLSFLLQTSFGAQHAGRAMTTVIGTWDGWVGAIHDVLGSIF